MVFGFGMGTGQGQPVDFSLVQQHWLETRAAHFNIYSCGTPQTSTNSPTVWNNFAKLTHCWLGHGPLLRRRLW